MAAYLVDYSRFPPGVGGLTSPVAYVNLIPPDVCAGSGTYGYVESCGWRDDYALASAGPDGVRGISPRHFLLAQDLLGAQPGAPGKTPYVRLTPRGYEFLDSCEPGADIVLVFDRSIYHKRKLGGSSTTTEIIP
jgi:hypothetical protein